MRKKRITCFESFIKKGIEKKQDFKLWVPLQNLALTKTLSKEAKFVLKKSRSIFSVSRVPNASWYTIIYLIVRRWGLSFDIFGEIRVFFSIISSIFWNHWKWAYLKKNTCDKSKPMTQIDKKASNLRWQLKNVKKMWFCS